MTDISTNPFLSEYETPFQIPPFANIKPEHFLPALEVGIQQLDVEISAIVNNPQAPSFENTIVALERSGKQKNKVIKVFYNLLSADTNDELSELSKIISPKLAELRDKVFLNRDLFQRINQLVLNIEDLGLNTEQERLLTEINKVFVRSGVQLDGNQGQRLREINKRIASLSVSFQQNVLGFEVEKVELWGDFV